MSSEKAATERLRELLDELNIKHFDYDKGGRTQTLWEAPDGNRHFTYETYDNPARTAKLVISWFPTPEQAIAATLGDDGVDELQAENVKLREQNHWLKQGDILHVLTDQEYINQCERERLMQVSIDALDKENAKLRELLQDMWRAGAFEPGACYVDEAERLEERTRKLGIEVDHG